MSKPTQKQIDAQIKWLEDNKTKIRHFSAFGEDNHAKVDAEIETLKEDYSEDDIYNRSCDEGDEDDGKEWTFVQRDAALEARRWMDGEEVESPKKSWKGLVQK